jgi:hypothetical protein
VFPNDPHNVRVETPPYTITLEIIERTFGRLFRVELLRECSGATDPTERNSYLCVMRKR